MAITQVSTSVLKDGAVTSAKLDTNIAITGDLTVDTNTLFVDSSTNSVGIGTDSPATQLHISSVGSTPAVRIESTHPSGIPFLDLKGAASSQIRYIDETGTIQTRIDMSDNGGFSFVDVAGSASPRMVINSSGNVGIGTTSPNAKLKIEGAVSNNGLSIKSGGNGGTYPFMVTWASGTEGDAFCIDDNLNVGIGTTSPTSKLHIIGNASIGTTGAASSSGLLVGGKGAFGNYVGSGDFGAAYNISLAAGITAKGINMGYNATADAGFIGVVHNGTGWKNLLLQPIAGNVGIGTTNPGYKLHVSGNSFIDATSASATLTLGRYSGQPTIKAGTDDSGYLIIDSSGGILGLNWYSSDNIAIAAGGGNVGIGGTNPSSKLEVISSVDSVAKFRSTAANSNVNIGDASSTTSYSSVIFNTNSGLGQIWKAGTSYSSWGGVSALNIYTSNGPIAFHPNTNANAMFLSTSGNVGIGTVSPADNLQVNGGVTFGSDTTLSHRSRIYESFGLNIDSGAAGGGRPLILRTNNTERMSITSGGSVTANVDMRAPIFYDSDNTSYYLHPASTSRINVIDYSQLKSPSSSNNGRFVNHGDWGTLHQTDSGYIQLGPANSTWAHIYTDRPAFYFNKNLYINNVQVQVVDATDIRYRGIISTQDWNTYIDGTEAGWYRVNNATGSNRPSAYAYGTELNFSIGAANKFQLYAPHNATDGNGIWARTGWSNDYDAWKEFVMFGQAPYSGGDLRAPIFYDSDNTGYYLDPQSLSNIGSISLNEIISSSAVSGDAKLGRNYAYHTLELKGFGSEMMIGAGSNTMHVNYRYCNNTASTSQTPQNWYWRAGTSTSFSNHYWGIGYGVSSLRAPIFYDSDNTGYYLEPKAATNLNAVHTTRIGVNRSSSSTSRHGISLYGGYSTAEPTYGLLFTGTSLGTHGSVTGDWATYFTMSGSTSRGWIFKHSTNLVASISGTGNAHFNGDVVAYSSSDERLKDNKKNIENALKKVESLNGVEFDWNDKQDVYEGHDIGIIAQEVEKIAPEIVNTRDNGYKAVKYEKLVPLLIEAIKELSDKVKALENK